MSAKRSPRDRRCHNTPPAEYQFAKGKSGNPGGRRKGSRNFHTLLAQIADSEVQMRRDGRTVTVTVAEAVIWKQIQEALNGDPRALQACLDRLERLSPALEEPEDDPASAMTTPEQDAATLARFRDAVMRQAAMAPQDAAEAGPDDDQAAADGNGNANADAAALPEGSDHE